VLRKSCGHASACAPLGEGGGVGSAERCVERKRVPLLLLLAESARLTPWADASSESETDRRTAQLIATGGFSETTVVRAAYPRARSPKGRHGEAFREDSASGLSARALAKAWR